MSHVGHFRFSEIPDSFPIIGLHDLKNSTLRIRDRRNSSQDRSPRFLSFSLLPKYFTRFGRKRFNSRRFNENETSDGEKFENLIS